MLLTLPAVFHKGCYRAFEAYPPEAGKYPQGSDGKPSTIMPETRQLSRAIVFGVLLIGARPCGARLGVGFKQTGYG
ncbi:hypothetical protein [Franconibacter pulveris]|uniref:hypothetical protein n=1 Tax=Franconibacter pulveris TaxID=435910 RepID=UPI000495723B|nr:hypothetical protein [Franconibacter pulveris]